jgi:ZIP family zinc transporter
MSTSWLVQFFREIVGTNLLLQGLVGGVMIAAFNMVGALLVVVWRKPSKRILDIALGFAAGVMLAASFTSLILPGVEYGGIEPVLIGLALGAVILDRADHCIQAGGPKGRRPGGCAPSRYSSWPSPCTICRKGWRSG